VNGFERRKEQKRGTILRAALDLFQAFGFSKVSIGDIAQRAGVSQVTIYNHFGNKEGLTREVIKGFIRSLLDKYRKVINGQGSYMEKLEFIIYDKTEVAQQFQGELLGRMVFSDPYIEQIIQSMWQTEVKQLMLDLVEDGKNQGYINPQLSEEAVLVYLEILRKGMFADPAVPTRMERHPQLVHDLNSLFLYGLNG